MTENTLQPIEQRQINFYGDELTAVRADDGHVYVAIRHMCDALGLTVAPQTRRIKRDELLTDGYQGVTVLVTPGGRQTYGMLRADLVPMWLTGIRMASVKEELREKLTAFNVSRVRAAPKTPRRRIVLIELSRTPNANLYRDFRGL